MRDATQWVHDRTVDGMNAGYRRPHPDAARSACPTTWTWARATARPAWNVRAIWENYAGWFHHRSTTELYGVPPAAVATRPGGRGRCRRAGRPQPEPGSTPAEPVAALHLTDIVLAVEPDHAGARARGGRRPPARCSTPVSNFWERAWLTRSIDRLEARDDEPGRLRLLRTPPCWSPAAPAASATPSPPPSPPPGPAVTVTGTRAGPDDYDTDLEPVLLPAGRDDRPGLDRRAGRLARRLDVLVNNAGANFPGGRDEWEPDTFAAALALNLVGPMRLTTGCRRPVGGQRAWTAAPASSTWRRWPRSGPSRSSPATARPRPAWSPSPATWPGSGSPTASGSTPWPPGSSTRR